MKVAFIIKCAWVVKIAREAQLCHQSDPGSVSHMQDCRRIVILSFLSSVARENRGADSYRLSELLTIEFDRLSLEIKAFARTSTGQQRAVIGDMADEFYVFNI